MIARTQETIADIRANEEGSDHIRAPSLSGIGHIIRKPVDYLEGRSALSSANIVYLTQQPNIATNTNKLNKQRLFDKLTFSDEAHFHITAYVILQNCRIWGSESPAYCRKNNQVTEHTIPEPSHIPKGGY